MRLRARASSASTSHRLANAERTIPVSGIRSRDDQTQSGTVPKYDPAIRFYQHAGATIAHQQTQAYPATPRRFGQVNNM